MTHGMWSSDVSTLLAMLDTMPVTPTLRKVEVTGLELEEMETAKKKKSCKLQVQKDPAS